VDPLTLTSIRDQSRELLVFSVLTVSSTYSWTADKDYFICGAFGGSGLLSWDKSLTWAGFVTPTANQVKLGFAATVDALSYWAGDLFIPWEKGRTLYFAAGPTKTYVAVVLLPAS
jgi:hypothetical protein